jgi:serine/threonine-protein kinase SRK2
MRDATAHPPPDYEDVGPSPRVLGTGSYGMTKLMRHKDSNERYAVKLIARGDQITDHVRREIVNHRSLCHPFIVQFKEAFVTDTYLGVAMEYVSGGELFNYVQQHRSFNEAQARYFFQHLVSGVEYLHVMRVVHRDLKLENLLVDLSGTSPQLKICDFGYSKSDFDSHPKTRIGTPAYISPEVYQGVRPYDGKASDVWACGVVLYVMLAGSYPFQDPDNPTSNHATMWRVLDVKYTLPMDLSPDGADLLRRVFVKDPSARIPIAGIRQHGWFVKDLSVNVPLGETQPSAEHDDSGMAQSLEKIDAIVNVAKQTTNTTQTVEY